MKQSLGVAAVLAASVISSAAVAGGSGCANCYKKVVHPPVYRTTAETVMVRPAMAVPQHIPAEYGHVTEKVLVQPERTIAHRTAPQYATVAEKVLVSPARKVWQVTRNAHGHEIGCWVTVPAQYAVQHRHVMVSPGHVVHQHVPAVYAHQTRTVQLRAAKTVHHVVPAEYAVQHRTEMVQPATASWKPIGGRSYYPHY